MAGLEADADSNFVLLQAITATHLSLAKHYWDFQATFNFSFFLLQLLLLLGLISRFLFIVATSLLNQILMVNPCSQEGRKFQLLIFWKEKLKPYPTPSARTDD